MKKDYFDRLFYFQIKQSNLSKRNMDRKKHGYLKRH